MIHKLVFSWRGALMGVLASFAAVGFVVPATAASGVTSVTSCRTIAISGNYRLDMDVTGGGNVCIDITASNVTLILNGHTAMGGFNGAVIDVEVGAINAKIVGPGTVVAGHNSAAIELGGGNGSVRGVTATSLSSPSGRGIEIDSSGNDVRGNVANGSGVGIIVGELATATGNTIIGNSAHGNLDEDLDDENPNCDSDVWRGNDFGFANQTCIH